MLDVVLDTFYSLAYGLKFGDSFAVGTAGGCVFPAVDESCDGVHDYSISIVFGTSSSNPNDTM